MSQARVGSESSSISDHREYDAIVVGVGFSGIYELYRLREQGLSVHALESGDGVGGTWHWNCYPGARVDSPCMQYSLSFSAELEQEWHWPEEYSAQPDLQRYFDHVADRFDLRKDISFNTTVIGATYDADDNRWTLETDRGVTYSAKYLVTAVGCLSATNIPAFKGLDSFRGDWYHTSRYPQNKPDLRGKRVGVIGTGSTGIQVITAIAPEVEQLYVFQRTANFSMPAQNKPMDPEFEKAWKARYPEHRQAARVSGFGAIYDALDKSALAVSEEEREQIYEAAWLKGGFNIALAFNDLTTNEEANETAAEFVRKKIRGIVKDPATAELLIPRGYPIFTKRPCFDTGYYEQYNRENVTLVDIRTNPIEEITPTGLRTTAEEYGLDVIIFATGFDALTGPLHRMNIVGKDGVKLQDKWQAGPRTYLGLATAGFPNLFMITGPGSPSVLSNMTTSIEQHGDWIADAIDYMEKRGLKAMEAERDAEDRWVEHVNEVANMTLHYKANSWYLGANIPGKPRVFIPYAGGVGPYREICDGVAEKGYEGFTFQSSAMAASAQESAS